MKENQNADLGMILYTSGLIGLVIAMAGAIIGIVDEDRVRLFNIGLRLIPGVLFGMLMGYSSIKIEYFVIAKLKKSKRVFYITIGTFVIIMTFVGVYLLGDPSRNLLFKVMVLATLMEAIIFIFFFVDYRYQKKLNQMLNEKKNKLMKNSK